MCGLEIVNIFNNKLRYFSSIIAQGQFPKLGLVLVTIVASIRNIFWKNEMFQESIQKTNFEDLGEVINIRTFERF